LLQLRNDFILDFLLLPAKDAGKYRFFNLSIPLSFAVAVVSVSHISMGQAS